MNDQQKFNLHIFLKSLIRMFWILSPLIIGSVMANLWADIQRSIEYGENDGWEGLRAFLRSEGR